MPLEDPMRERVEALKPDIFVHAAGIASVKDSLVNPGKVFEETIALTGRSLQAVVSGQPTCRYVAISSAAVQEVVNRMRPAPKRSSIAFCARQVKGPSPLAWPVATAWPT